MADVPLEMMTGERQSDESFEDTEELYRRFMPDHLDGSEVALEAFELPDMSVNRGKYGPAKWLLLDGEFQSWGVGAFKVQDIPPDKEVHHLGIIVYSLKPEHRPLKYNYPHSEVRIYRDEVLICQKDGNVHLLEPEFHLRWRERLSQSSRVTIYPKKR